MFYDKLLLYYKPLWFLGSLSLRLHNNIVAGKRGWGVGAVMGKAGGGGVGKGEIWRRRYNG